MTDQELLDEVRRLRATGASPKEIARGLGMRPARVEPMVRQVAAEAPVPTHDELVGCWISPGWSRELLVRRREGWDDVDLGPGGPAGVALVLIARGGRRDQVRVSGFLVDTFCLGVKNTIGPRRMRRRELPNLVRVYFAAFPRTALCVPLELAQHVVHGAVAFAGGLGREPHPEFELVRGELGELTEPCAITFGRDGRPVYVAGPHDDPIAIMRALQAAVGSDGFAVAA